MFALLKDALDHQTKLTRRYDELCTLDDDAPDLVRELQRYSDRSLHSQDSAQRELKRLKTSCHQDLDRIERSIEKKELVLRSRAGGDAKVDELYRARIHAAMEAHDAARESESRRKADAYIDTLKSPATARTTSRTPKMSESEEAAHCDNLVADLHLLEHDDQDADIIRTYDDAKDAVGSDTPTSVVRSGAVWLANVRVPGAIHTLLKPHQNECMSFLLRAMQRNAGAIVAHAMGMGKTLTILATLQVCSLGGNRVRAIVACPLSVVDQWYQQAVHWKSIIDLDCFVINDVESIDHLVTVWMRHGGILIINHDKFKKWASTPAFEKDVDGPDLIIVFDEAHKQLKSKKTGLYGIMQKTVTSRRILMTGTLMPNNFTELYHQVDLVAPGLLGKTHENFMHNYAQWMSPGNMRAASCTEDAKEFQQAVELLRLRLQHVMHYANADLLKTSLRPKSEFCVTHSFDVDDDEDDEEDDQSSLFHARSVVATRARPIKVRVTNAIIDAIREAAPDDKIVVFSPYVETLAAMCQKREGLMYHGSMNTQKRNESLQTFRKRPDHDLLYVTTTAGGVGLDLTCANRVILMDASYNPADDNQALARCYRMGQDKQVYVYRLIAGSTVEQLIYKDQVQKQMCNARVFDDRSVTLRDFIGDDDDFALDLPTIGKAELSARDVALWNAKVAHKQAHGESLAVHDHDATMREDAQSCELDASSKNESLNFYHSFCNVDTSRYVVVGDGAVECVPPGACYTRANALVPPYPPFFQSFANNVLRLSFKTMPANAQKDNMFTTCVTYSVDQPCFLRLGPYSPKPHDGVDKISFEVAYSKNGGAFTPSAKCTAHVFKNDPKYANGYRMLLGFTGPGEYTYKARFVDADGNEGPWSEPSACITVA